MDEYAFDEDLSAAEEKVIAAVHAGVGCDFADKADDNPTPDEMAAWGPERTVRAALLVRLAEATNGAKARQVSVSGAAVAGNLDLTATVAVLHLPKCRLDTVQAVGAVFGGDVNFEGATFTGDALFGGATFNAEAAFSQTTFISEAEFGDTTFNGDCLFDEATFRTESRAWFHAAVFNGDVVFKGATFAVPAMFHNARFNRDAVFDDADFTGGAGFKRAAFAGHTGFNRAHFTGQAEFERTTFAGHSRFTGARFTCDAKFNGATFTRDASFDQAEFAGSAGFDRVAFAGRTSFADALADTYSLIAAQFVGADPGPWVARTVTMTRAIFHVRSRVAILATHLDCSRMQAREGVHLVVRALDVELGGAEFLRRSVVTGSSTEPDPPHAEPTATGARQNLIGTLSALGTQPGDRPQILSMRQAIVGDLTLGGVGLERCAFAGAHGLDKLRIDPTCTFAGPPPWRRDRPWWRFTRRRMLDEEARWRYRHAPKKWPAVPDTPGVSATTGTERSRLPTANEIAGIYRDLRKGLEDAKDEPGAADFYYGEMEMRRLAGRERTVVGVQAGAAPFHVEGWLLTAYWATSGYGLRAWRALAALTVVVLGCAWLFTLDTFAHPTAIQEPTRVDLKTGTITYSAPVSSHHANFGQAFEFTARESLTITRVVGSQLLQTTGPGSAIDIALRLLVPVLLGLALLSVRGRIKR